MKKSDPNGTKENTMNYTQKKSKNCATMINGRLHIKFEYDPKLVTSVKELSGRRWNSTAKTWIVPATVEAGEWCEKHGLPFDETAKAWWKKLTQPISVKKLFGLDDLYPFQREGVEFLASRNGSGLIADEMGLGKTIQALGYLRLHKEALPAVVVSPASVKLNWVREAKKWCPEVETFSLTGKPKDSVARLKSLLGRKNSIIVVNYDILKAWLPALVAVGVRTMVLDECHYVKNPKAQRTKTVKELKKTAKNVIALSGTPIVNRPIEFFTTLNLLAPEVYPSFWKYAQRYCGAKHNGFGWDFTGSTNVKELYQKLGKTVMIRRKKKEVLTQLPPKVRIVVPLNDLKNRKEYDSAKKELIRWKDELKERADDGDETSEKQLRAFAMTMFGKLKQAAVQIKLESCLDWIHDYLETEQKLVVFCHHKETVQRLKKDLSAYNPVTIDGSVDPNARQALVDEFQQNPSTRVFVGTLAAKEGITLTAAHATCFLELWWTPGDHDQAEDRVHRIGQDHDSVTAYYLTAVGTVEEDIMILLDLKRNILSNILDGKNVKDFDLLTMLLKNFDKTTTDRERG